MSFLVAPKNGTQLKGGVGTGLELCKAPFPGVRMGCPLPVVPGIMYSDRYRPYGADAETVAVANTLAQLATFRLAHRY